MSWALLHKHCGDVAFYFLERPVPGQVFHACDVRLPDGSTPRADAERLCGSCGHIVYDDNLRDEYLREETEPS